jgi:hypothetical protein
MLSSSPDRQAPVWRQAIGHSEYDPGVKGRESWNAGRKLGARRALKPQQVWAIRFSLDRDRRVRDRAMFDLAIDSKLRGCDIVRIRTGDLVSGGRVRSRVIAVQRKTSRPGGPLAGPGTIVLSVRFVGWLAPKRSFCFRPGTITDVICPPTSRHARKAHDSLSAAHHRCHERPTWSAGSSGPAQAGHFPVSSDPETLCDRTQQRLQRLDVNPIGGHQSTNDGVGQNLRDGRLTMFRHAPKSKARPPLSTSVVAGSQPRKRSGGHDGTPFRCSPEDPRLPGRLMMHASHVAGP